MKEVGAKGAPPTTPHAAHWPWRGVASLTAQGPRWDSEGGVQGHAVPAPWKVGRPRGQPALTPHLQIEDGSTERDSLLAWEPAWRRASISFLPLSDVPAQGRAISEKLSSHLHPVCLAPAEAVPSATG